MLGVSSHQCRSNERSRHKEKERRAISNALASLGQHRQTEVAAEWTKLGPKKGTRVDEDEREQSGQYKLTSSEIPMGAIRIRLYGLSSIQQLCVCVC